jgi:DNA-binding FadR family transcriptional regulator
VREAIRSLENAGLLIVKTGVQGGAFVNKVDKKPMLESVGNMLLTNQISHKEIAEARLLIEPSLAAEAARKFTPTDLKLLRKSISILKNHGQFKSGCVERAQQSDSR